MKILFLMIFCLIYKRHIFKFFWIKSVDRVQSDLKILQKNFVALKTYNYWQNFWKFAEMLNLTIKQKYIKNKNFHRVVFELLAWND